MSASAFMFDRSVNIVANARGLGVQSGAGDTLCAGPKCDRVAKADGSH